MNGDFPRADHLDGSRSYELRTMASIAAKAVDSLLMKVSPSRPESATVPSFRHSEDHFYRTIAPITRPVG